MRILTLACSECGTIVAANELETHRVRKCPRISCDNVLRFADLPESDRQHFLDNQERYRM